MLSFGCKILILVHWPSLVTPTMMRSSSVARYSKWDGLSTRTMFKCCLSAYWLIGKESIISLRMAKKRLSYVRIVSLTASVYMYHGVWIITDITVQSPEQAVVSMLQMPHVCSED